MKVFSFYLMGLVVILSLSCNKDIYHEELTLGDIPAQYIDLNNKINQLILKNKSIIPQDSRIQILWNTAIQIENHLEVELMIGENKLLIPMVKNLDGKLLTGKTILKIEDISNPSSIYIYGILSENSMTFLNQHFKIDDLYNNNFDGYVMISDISFKPFSAVSIKKGCISKNYKINSIEKMERKSMDHLGLRIKCEDWYWGTVVYDSAGNEVSVEPWYYIETICEWELEDFEDCINYPWLCEDDPSGGGDVEEPDAICNCNNDVFSESGFQYTWPTIFGQVTQNHWLQVVEVDCKNGIYSGHTQYISDNPSIYQIIIEQNDAHEILSQPKYVTTSNGNQIICGAHVTWSWNLVAYLKTGVGDMATGSWYAQPQYMHLVFDIN